MNYQQDDWTKQLSVAEFQYNDKKHVTIGHTLFELNFGRYIWKENLMVKIELPKLEDFLEILYRSQKEPKRSMKITKEAMKKQFNKKRYNLQELKVSDNVWLKAKNI